MSDRADAPLTTKAFIVRGRVQGVGFRWWTAKRAREIGVTGTVRNLNDGSVEVVACGSEEQLQQLTAQLHQGPPMARVQSVDEAVAPTHFSSEKFEIV